MERARKLWENDHLTRILLSSTLCSSSSGEAGPQFTLGAVPRLDYSDENVSRSRISDWMIRGGVALVFVLFGFEKFPSRPDAQWVRLFQEIGVGRWFRYLTGVAEVAGALLILLPKTARAGFALLSLDGERRANLGVPARSAGRRRHLVMFCLALPSFWRAR